MMAEQGSTNMVPMSEMPHPNVDQYADYCARLAERVLSDENFSWEDAAKLMFDEEPSYTFVRTA